MSGRVGAAADGDGVPITEPMSLTMSCPAVAALDRHWATSVTGGDAIAALDRWRTVPELPAPDLGTLAAHIRSASKADADRGCAELARRAPADRVASRVLLQVLRPGLRHLGRRLALGGRFDDVDQKILAIAWEQIRTYPIHRHRGS